MRRLIFWDIDKTLVTFDAVSAEYWARALLRSTGRVLERLPDFAGMTDRYLVSETLAAHGVEVSEPALEAFYEAMVTEAAASSTRMREVGRALPGASAALTALAARPEVAQSVVTGNLEPIARQKLHLFDLDAHIDFEIGGYGSDSAVRADVLGLALERASRKHALERTVVIGDTPHDIGAARAHDALAIGVATGKFTAEELRESGADVVFESLADTEALIVAVSA